MHYLYCEGAFVGTLAKCHQVDNLSMYNLLYLCCCSLVASVTSNSFPTPRTVAGQVITVHGISWAKILEWVVISISSRYSPHRDWTHISCFFYHWITREALYLCKSKKKHFQNSLKNEQHMRQLYIGYLWRWLDISNILHICKILTIKWNIIFFKN